jgi:bacterioferritin (cytochrome b1)
MELDLMQVKDEQGFKDWLKTQKRLMKQSGRDDYF